MIKPLRHVKRLDNYFLNENYSFASQSNNPLANLGNKTLPQNGRYQIDLHEIALKWRDANHFSAAGGL